MNIAKDFTEDEVLAAVEGSLGIMSKVAQNLGCTWGTAQAYVKKYASALKAWDDEREKMLDLAESKIFKAINLDDIGSAKWLLSTRGRERGYGNQIELSGQVDGGWNQPIEIKIIGAADLPESESELTE